MALSKEESERIFSTEERIAAAEKVAPELRSALKNFDRDMDKADRALADYAEPTGTYYDLLDFERYAERAQLSAGKVAGLENHITSLLTIPHN